MSDFNGIYDQELAKHYEESVYVLARFFDDNIMRWVQAMAEERSQRVSLASSAVGKELECKTTHLQMEFSAPFF